jgi:hypothetical protein
MLRGARHFACDTDARSSLQDVLAKVRDGWPLANYDTSITLSRGLAPQSQALGLPGAIKRFKRQKRTQPRALAAFHNDAVKLIAAWRIVVLNDYDAALEGMYGGKAADSLRISRLVSRHSLIRHGFCWHETVVLRGLYALEQLGDERKTKGGVKSSGNGEGCVAGSPDDGANELVDG